MTSALALVHVRRKPRHVARNPSEAAVLVGKRIREKRKELAMTQDQLANDCGIDSSNIRAYESGRGLPNVYTIVRLAAALYLDPADLVRGLTIDMFPL